MLVVNLQIIILIIVVSLFCVPNSAFANSEGPEIFVMPTLFLISLVVVPIALVYLGIILLRSFKPSLGNYIHSNRFIKIGLYFLAEGISWAYFGALINFSLYSVLGILTVFLVILFISIGGMLIIKHLTIIKNLKIHNSLID